MHEALLGADYPLFAASVDDVADVAAAAVDPAVFGLAASRTSAAAASFALDRAAGRLRTYLARAVPSSRPDSTGLPHSAGSSGAPLRVVIAGHDLNVLHPAYRVLPSAARAGGPGRPVAALGEHDEVSSRVKLAEWGRCSHLRVVRPERGLVLPATSAGRRGSWSICTASSCTRSTRARFGSATGFSDREIEKARRCLK